MIIRRLTLADYGPYAGEHSFELETIQNKPIITPINILIQTTIT